MRRLKLCLILTAISSFGCAQGGNLTVFNKSELLSVETKSLEYYSGVGALPGPMSQNKILVVDLSSTPAARVEIRDAAGTSVLKSCTAIFSAADANLIDQLIRHAKITVHADGGPVCVDGGYNAINLFTAGGDSKLYKFDGCDAGISGQVLQAPELESSLGSILSQTICQ